MPKTKPKRTRNAGVKGLRIAKRGDKQAEVIDFDYIDRNSQQTVEGSAADLIRDGYDHPRRWLHNSEAQPDDRQPAFLVGRGWSATEDKRFRLSCANIPVMAVNDFPKNGPKPDYWCTGDPCNYFGERIWTDPEIMKFSPFDFRISERPREDAFAPRLDALTALNSHFFHHVNNETEYESWLHTPWIAWGSTIFGERVPTQFYKKGAARSSMLVGLRLLWHLGFREIYLLGCDCTPHDHPAPEYWNTIFYLLEQIKPTLDRWGLTVYQTNFDSHLRCFEFRDFEESVVAIQKVRSA
jgi:hypothetical protein